MAKTTLRNDFHNTEATVLLPPSGGTLSWWQAYRVKRALCGRDDCACGEVRGPQDFEWEYDLAIDDATGKEYATYTIHRVPKPFENTSMFAGVKEFCDDSGREWRAIVDGGSWQILLKVNGAFVHQGYVNKSRDDSCGQIFEKWQEAIDRQTAWNSYGERTHCA